MPISRQLAHDLKNPLTIINGYVSLLAESDLSVEQLNQIKKVQEAAMNLLKLIDDNKEPVSEN